jgi:hypothetical protein
MEMSNGGAGGGALSARGTRVAERLGFALVLVIVLALAFPVYVPLRYRVPGLQALTPNKVLLPLLVPVAVALGLSQAARRRWRNPVTWAFGLLVAWELTSAALNETGNLVLNFKNLVWLVLAFALSLVMAATANTPRRRWFLGAAIAAVACLLSVFGFIEIHAGTSWDRFFAHFRPQGIAGDMVGNGPDTLLPVHSYFGKRRILQSTLASSHTLALLATFLFGVVVETLDRPRRPRGGLGWLVLALFWLTACGTWFTYSRGAVIQLATGITVALAVAARVRRRVPWTSMGAAVSVALVVVILDPASVNSVAGKFDSTRYGLVELQRVESPPAAGGTVAQPPSGSFSVAQRLILARVAVDMAARYPVFGAGPFNFRPLLYGDPHYQAMFRLPVLAVFDAHNFYLTSLATLGVAGLASLLAVLVVAVRQIASGIGPVAWRPGALAAMAVWAAFVAGGFFGFSLLDPVSDVVFAVLLGGVLVVCPAEGARLDERRTGQDARGQ